MNINFKHATYAVTRAVALARVWLSVAPVLAGSYGAFNNPEKPSRSSGQSVVYKSNDVTVVYKNQFFGEIQSYVTRTQVIDYF